MKWITMGELEYATLEVRLQSREDEDTYVVLRSARVSTPPEMQGRVHASMQNDAERLRADGHPASVWRVSTQRISDELTPGGKAKPRPKTRRSD